MSTKTRAILTLQLAPETLFTPTTASVAASAKVVTERQRPTNTTVSTSLKELLT
ncbi:MAG: hypothetical protein UW39_C0028G0001, partial [Parcubacteria group bacterium GW2011_GWC2_44_17]